MENQDQDKRPSAARDGIPGSRPAHMTRAMRMFQKHGSPSRVLDVEYEVINPAPAQKIVLPSTDVLIPGMTKEDGAGLVSGAWKRVENPKLSVNTGSA